MCTGKCGRWSSRDELHPIAMFRILFVPTIFVQASGNSCIWFATIETECSAYLDFAEDVHCSLSTCFGEIFGRIDEEWDEDINVTVDVVKDSGAVHVALENQARILLELAIQ
jgi:hypothetical protein